MNETEFLRLENYPGLAKIIMFILIQQAQETFKMRLTIATSILGEASKKN